jgi:hypothetical protein
MSGHNGNFERTGGQVSEVNIFEGQDPSSCVKKKTVISTLDVNTKRTMGALTFFLQEMKASFIDKGAGLFV